MVKSGFGVRNLKGDKRLTREGSQRHEKKGMGDSKHK